MRVAFCSSDGQFVDQHFGTSDCFHIWEVGPEKADYLGTVGRFAAGDDQEDKIVIRAEALRGCTMVYTAQIGGPAAAKLVGRHIHPMKTTGPAPISVLLERLQVVLRGRPPPWLAKATAMVSASNSKF